MRGEIAYGLGNSPVRDMRHTDAWDSGTRGGMFFFLSPAICQTRRKTEGAEGVFDMTITK